MRAETINYLTTATSKLTSFSLSLSREENRTNPDKETGKQPPKLSRLLSITELLRLLEVQTKLCTRLFERIKRSESLEESKELEDKGDSSGTKNSPS